jgi:hypothetical protein
MSLGTQGFASSLLAMHLMLLLCTSAFWFCFQVSFAYYPTHFSISSNTPPSIWDTNTSPIFPHCGVCLNIPSPALPLPSPTPIERWIIHKVLEIWNIPSLKPFQVEVITCLCFSTKRRLYLVQKMGGGKCAVILASATIL